LSGRIDNYAKKNISTKQSSSGKKTRLSGADGDQKRTQRNQTTAGKRTQAINGSSLLDFSLPKDARLRKPREFHRVYAEGKRFEGRLMTVFIMPSATGFQRLGITASKKAIGNAVQRNRAKRLLRETFRLSKAKLNELETKFDWVLNARRNLLRVKLEQPLKEFRQIVERVKIFELKIKQGEENVKAEAK
jgi:ribonuclease P protein component